MTVHISVDPTTDERWSRLVTEAGGSLFTSPPWLRALRNTYGFEFRAEMVLDETGEAVSGLAWTHVSDLRGQRVITLPFSDYADPIVADPSHWPSLTDAMFDRGLPIRAKSLRSDHLVGDHRLRVVNEAAWHAVDLQRDPDQMWESLSQSARRAIRRAEKAGVKVRRAVDLDDVHAFHRLHCGVRREKYQMLTQPVVLFEQLWQEFGLGDRFVLLLAELGDEIIGGTLYLEWGGALYYKFNASNLSDLRARPNDSLVWQGLLHGAHHDLDRLDFGLSDLDQEGLLRFKEKFATERRTIRAFRFDPDDWTEPISVLGGTTLTALTELFTAPGVPGEVYQGASELLYRNFC